MPDNDFDPLLQAAQKSWWTPSRKAWGWRIVDCVMFLVIGASLFQLYHYFTDESRGFKLSHEEFVTYVWVYDQASLWNSSIQEFNQRIGNRKKTDEEEREWAVLSKMGTISTQAQSAFWNGLAVSHPGLDYRKYLYEVNVSKEAVVRSTQQPQKKSAPVAVSSTAAPAPVSMTAAPAKVSKKR